MKALAVLQLSLPPAPPASWEAQPGPAAQAPAWAPREAPHPPATDQSQPAPGFSAPTLLRPTRVSRPQVFLPLSLLTALPAQASAEPLSALQPGPLTSLSCPPPPQAES